MKKYAIISDIHGNLPAFQAVMDDARDQNVDFYILAGDYYLCLQYPNEIIDIIRNLENAFIIKGNNEQYFDALQEQAQRTWADGQFEALYWYYKTISPENHDFLRKLPPKIEFKEHGNPYMRVAHWSEELLNTALFNDLSGSSLLSCNKNSEINKKEYMQNKISAIEKSDGLSAVIEHLPMGAYIFGHTHFQWHYSFNGRLLINPGSCGLPVDFDNRAAYTILEWNDGQLNVEERRITYDIDLLIKDLEESTLYKNAKVWSELTRAALLTGTEQHTFFLKFAKKYANDIGDKVRPFSKKTWTKAHSLWCSSDIK